MALLINSKLTKKWVSPSSLELEALLVSDVVAMPLFLVAPSLCWLNWLTSCLLKNQVYPLDIFQSVTVLLINNGV